MFSRRTVVCGGLPGAGVTCTVDSTLKCTMRSKTDCRRPLSYLSFAFRRICCGAVSSLAVVSIAGFLYVRWTTFPETAKIYRQPCGPVPNLIGTLDVPPQARSDHLRPPRPPQPKTTEPKHGIGFKLETSDNDSDSDSDSSSSDSEAAASETFSDKEVQEPPSKKPRSCEHCHNVWLQQSH